MLDGMKKKGLVGFAAGDKGGWEAMGSIRHSSTARVNGDQFHVDLTGRPREVDRCKGDRSVLDTGLQLLPYMNPNVLQISSGMELCSFYYRRRLDQCLWVHGNRWKLQGAVRSRLRRPFNHFHSQ